MSQSAIGNLSESLELLKGTIEVLLQREAQYQKLITEELSIIEDPEEFILACDRNSTLVKMSFVFRGETEGISNTGDVFYPDDLDFSNQETVEDLPVSVSYINDMGTWAYTMRCPVVRDGREIADLYVEYIYDSFDEALPDNLYNGSATLYIMDRQTERFLLKPKGVGECDAGHLNLQDFYRANDILEETIQQNVAESIAHSGNMMFYHKIQNKESLIYMWAVNGGSVYLIGYVPVESIQREGDAVNQNILIVVIFMLATFFICCGVFFLYERQQNKFRKEREEERAAQSAARAGAPGGTGRHSEGKLVDLSCLEIAANLRDVVKVSNTVDGKLVAIPQELVVYGLFVNQDRFDQYELELPDTPEEFLECCRLILLCFVLFCSVLYFCCNSCM